MRAQKVEEDANLIIFGPEFQDVQCLLISEVKVLLQVQKANRMSGGGVVNPVMLKSISYCDKFSKFSDRQTVKDIRNLFDQEYAQFEIAQIANLCCDSVEEAVVLIPSLATKNDAALQLLLDELQKLKNSSY